MFAANSGSGVSSRGTTPRNSSHTLAADPLKQGSGARDGLESSNRDDGPSFGQELRLIQTLLKELSSMLVQLTVPVIPSVGSTLAVPIFYTNVNHNGSSPSMQHSATSPPPSGANEGGGKDSKSNSLEVLTALVTEPTATMVVGDPSRDASRAHSLAFGTVISSPEHEVTPDSNQATPMTQSLDPTHASHGVPRAVQQICQGTLLSVRRALNAALDDLEKMVGDANPNKTTSTFLLAHPAQRPLDLLLNECLPKALRGSRDSILGARFAQQGVVANVTLSPTSASQVAARNFSGQSLTQFQAFGLSSTVAPDGDQGDEGSEVSNWLKETYSSDSGTRRLRQSKNESTTKRSVTRMASNASRTSAVELPPSHLLPPSDAVPPTTPPDMHLAKTSIGNAFAKKATAEAHDNASRRRNPSIAFKAEEEICKDNDVESEGESLTGHPQSDDPFANVKPLSTPELTAAHDDDDGAHNPPSLSAKPLMRRSSQYFRRQSAVLAPGAMMAANAAVSGGQTLNNEDVIQMRLTALRVPWLDVDSPDFDIFESAMLIDQGDINLMSRRPSNSSSSLSSPTVPKSPNEPTGELSSKHIFIYVCINVMLRYSFVDALKVDLKKLYAFLGAVEALYRSENPYHNSIHAADVLQTSHIYLMNNDVYENFFDREILCLFLAALAHDIGHLGVNNQFLIKTRHPLAVLYNNLSPLENMHSLIVFRLLERDELNFLRDSDVWSSEDYAALSEKVVEMVIATDMKFHGTVVALAKDMFREGFSVGDGDVEKLIKMIIHCADLSNPMKARPVYEKWLERVVAEFFSQGEAEKERGLPISPNFDRNTGKIPEMQVGFITFVVRPYARAMEAILPPQWLERLDDNLAHMQSLCGSPYENQHRVLAWCKNRWIDTFETVRPILETVASLSPDTTTNLRVDRSCGPDPTADEPLLDQRGADKGVLPPLASSSPPTSRSSSSIIKRPGSSSTLVAPAVAMVSESQTRFAIDLMDFSKRCVGKLISDFADGQLLSKVSAGEHQRSFASGIVRKIVKSIEMLTVAHELNKGKRSAEELIDSALKRLRTLLTSYRCPTDAEISALPNNTSSCLELMKSNWAALQAEENFTRYTPRDFANKPLIFADAVRLSYQLFQAVFSGLSAFAARPGISTSGSSLYASIDTVPGFNSNSSGHLSMDEAPMAAGLSMLPGPLFRPSGNSLLQQLTGTDVSRSQPGPLRGVLRPLQNGASSDPIPINGRFSAPLAKPLGMGLPPITIPAKASNPTPNVQPPPASVAYHHGVDASTQFHDLPSQESLRHDDDDELVILATEERSAQTAAVLEELERQSQLHFQQSDEQWRTTQDGDASPRSSEFASVSSFRNVVRINASQPPAAVQSRNGSPSGPRTRIAPIVVSAQRIPNDNGPESPSTDNGDRPPSAFSNPSRDPHSAVDHPLTGIAVPGIPDAYFIHQPQGMHAAHASPQRVAATDAGGMQQLEGLSFIPMVHSLDPSPRRTGPAVHSPGTGALDAHAVVGGEFNMMDTHNLIQLETFLAHHAALGQAVAHAYHSTANSVSGSPVTGSLPGPGGVGAQRHPLGSRLVRGASHLSNRSASPEQLASVIDDNDLHAAGASLTSLSHAGIPSPSHLGAQQSNPSPSHSPKRRRNRNPATGGSSSGGGVTPQMADDSPLNNPIYRQQVAEMVVNGMENHTFGSRSGSLRMGEAAQLAAPTSQSPLPSLTPQQQHEIEDGCLVPEVYRASSMRSNASSFRRPLGATPTEHHQ